MYTAVANAVTHSCCRLKSDRRDDPAFQGRGGAVQGCPRRVGLPLGFLHISGACVTVGGAHPPWVGLAAQHPVDLPTLQPTDDNIVKLALHASGVLHHPQGDTDKPVSTPRTITSHGDDGLRVPRSSLRRLRSELRGIYPELAEKPFAATRLCW
jgi:hypothetical protein